SVVSAYQHISVSAYQRISISAYQRHPRSPREIVVDHVEKVGRHRGANHPTSLPWLISVEPARFATMDSAWKFDRESGFVAAKPHIPIDGHRT
ncbi:MAG: hypothetical protein ACLFVJ_22420, partial [Persicimonas sp.]